MASRSRRKCRYSLVYTAIVLMCLQMCRGQENTTVSPADSTKPLLDTTLSLIVPPRLGESPVAPANPPTTPTNQTTPPEATTDQRSEKVTEVPTRDATPANPPKQTVPALSAPTTVVLNHSLNTLTSTTAPDETCAGERLLPVQPIYSEYAHVTKCVANATLAVNFVRAIFYDGCIEEEAENATVLDDEIFDPCAGGNHVNYVYGDQDDEVLYVLQNGSLLRVNKDMREYDVFETYCLFADEATGQTLALVCYDQVVTVSKAQAYLYAICMLVSVPCLLVTAYLYLAIESLRNLHGKSLACHCICMALGFLLLSAVEIHGSVGTTIGYLIQYLLLACFLWLAVMCIDICTHVWYIIPRRLEITPRITLCRFIFYAVLAQGIPLILVVLSVSNNLNGMPSYFLKGVTEATRWSQQFFIPPISCILGVCLILLIAAYFGFRTLDPIVSKSFLSMKLKEQHNVHVNVEVLDVRLYEDTKQLAKSTVYLYIIMAMCWVFEIISFYVSSSMTLDLFDILNALQGIVIFIIFVSLPKPLYIIKHWWIDRGECNTTEMTPIA